MAPRDSIPRRLFRLAVPVVGLNVLNVLSVAVDTAMCARLDDDGVALAALGFAGQIVFLSMVGMMGLTVGAVALVARAYGAGEHDRVARVVRQSTWWTGIVSAIVAVIGWVGTRPLLDALGATDAIAEVGASYLQPLLVFGIFYFLSLLYAGLLRGIGNTALPFFIALLSNGLNVVFNYGLIFGNFGLPAMGAEGAAYGTVASQAIGTIVLIVFLVRGRVKGLRLELRRERLDLPLGRELFRIGAPAALDLLVLNIAFLSMVWMLARIDALAVAAHGIGLRIQSLAIVPGLGISQATSAMIGNALGAGDVGEARAVTRASVALCTALMTFLGVVILVGNDWILGRAFHVDLGGGIGHYAHDWMRLLGISMPLVGINIALTGMLRGAGATYTSLRINVLATFAFQLPLGAFLAFVVGLDAFGVWIALPLSFLVRVGLAVTAYRAGGWAKVGATV